MIQPKHPLSTARQIRPLLTIAACCAALLASGVFSPQLAFTQLSESSVVISEFFEEIHLVDIENGTVSDILNSPTGESPFGQHLEIIDQDTIAITSFSEIFLYDVATQSTSLLADLSFTPSEIAVDTQGNLVATTPDGVFGIDVQTGAETLIYEGTFFSPDDAVVDASGNIFVTEFFDALGVVSPNGGFRQIGDFETNQFAHLDLGPDGFLYLSTTFDAEFFRVNPITGEFDLLASDAFTFLDDLQVAEDGTVLFTGEVDSVSGVFSLDPLTGSIATVIDGDNENGGFFDPLDIDIFLSANRAAVPEPASTVVLAAGLILGCCRRRRST